MRLLLDTHVVLFLYGDTRALGPESLETLVIADEVAVSVVAFVEIGIKAAIRKLPLPPRLEEQVAADGLRVLGLSPADGLALASLPLHHRDPFDRLLIAQAQREDLTIVTTDRAFEAYDVRTLDPLS